MHIKFLSAFVPAGLLILAACSGQAASTIPPSSSGNSSRPISSDRSRTVGSNGSSAAPGGSQTLINANYALSTAGAATLLPQYAAKQMGFFARHGLNTDLIQIQGGPPTIAAIQANDVAAGVLSTQLVFNGVAQGAPLVSVAEEVSGYGVHVIVSSKIARERNIALTMSEDTMMDDIKGLKVGGLTPGSSPTLMFQGLLKTKGKSDWIQSGNTGNPEATLVALQNGIVDAIVAGPPSGEIAESAGYGKIIWSTLSLEDFRKVAYGVTVMNPNWAESHPQVAEEMVAAMDDAQKWIYANPDDAAKLAATLFPNLPVAQLPAIIKDMSFAQSARMSPEDMKAAQKMSNDYAMTNSPVTDDTLARSYTTKYSKT